MTDAAYWIYLHSQRVEAAREEAQRRLEQTDDPVECLMLEAAIAYARRYERFAARVEAGQATAAEIEAADQALMHTRWGAR